MCEADAKHSLRRLQRSICAWRDCVKQAKEAKWIDRVEKSSTEIEKLRSENARLRGENERFARLIDSGEWGRGRVEELRKVRSIELLIFS